ncbi:hypothetical protein [Pseudoalteromonas rubra]|uniref:hypothetical protein n=1 Tax=Pseudoalteromonas rubra TaxID=43658 RepID=UPI000F7A0CF6|nr:hypothetical protein [Pseudoalteromonas rubra]
MITNVAVTYENKTSKPIFAFLCQKGEIKALTLTQIFPGSTYKLSVEFEDLNDLEVGFGDSWSNPKLVMPLTAVNGSNEFQVCLDDNNMMEIEQSGVSVKKHKRYFYDAVCV